MHMEQMFDSNWQIKSSQICFLFLVGASETSGCPLTIFNLPLYLSVLPSGRGETDSRFDGRPPVNFSISSPLQLSFSSSLHPSPLALLILPMHNTASPGQAWTGGRSHRPDPQTKQPSTIRMPPLGPRPLGKVLSAGPGLLISC